MNPTGVAALMLGGMVTGCSLLGPRHGAAICAQPTPAGALALPVDELAGRYRLVFVASSGPGRGRQVEGSLRLLPRPNALRPVLALDLQPLPELSEPLYGMTTADLSRIGAYTEGSLLSEDPAQPGVALRVRDRGSQREISLRFGSEANRRDQWTLDAAEIDAVVVRMDASGFSGVWEATIGSSMYRAGGYFCARRAAAS